ncbi:3-methyl-2-oxobutanoate hydroxymethyltransferase [Laspinema olomoucense]|uniref:3-methyl-2-oxobutanoate hydroxymethyltransferase n=1 Tax=Laspinema olomoucense TaxID=3231600 RepID=UPI0021BB336B|nr:3-methyl-2-oxobutanoate hydroxymethyltransferase [Laspinema sp. D3c]MCT7994118.1 3-methyl-2-oxobutanoate hydroxymethyltransferase [Laspinema sp. D3c]
MPITPQQLLERKQQGMAIVALTAYDYVSAKLLDRAGVDLLLVGDSLGMVVLGYETTLPLTLDEMIHHAKAVRRGIEKALMVVDLPFLTYQESFQQAMHSAGRILKETGAQAVKLEGGYPEIAETVRRLVLAGIPVLGHVGLTPQSVHQLGYRKQGKTPETGDRILKEAIALQEAGAFAVVLEHIPSQLAAEISKTLVIPTIGIGAGVHCDGQVLVTHDLLGMTDRVPPFAKRYANLQETITQAVQAYGEDVRDRRFPSD